MNKNLTFILLGILFILTASHSAAQGTLSKINLDELSKIRTLDNNEILRIIDESSKKGIDDGGSSTFSLKDDGKGGPSYASVIELDNISPGLSSYLTRYKSIYLKIFNASEGMSLIYSGPVNTVPDLGSLLLSYKQGALIYTQLIGVKSGTSQVEIISEYFYEIQ